MISDSDALIVVDVQNDFIPGGALAVEDGDQIIEGINRIQKFFHENNAVIVLTQDWHPKNHNSFASTHPGKQPFEIHEEIGIGPVLWPDHCVQGTKGAEFHPELNIGLAKAIIRKGFRPQIDSYSGFIENDKKTLTGLSGYLKAIGIKNIFICGLALDFCVYYTAIDGKKLGFNVNVIVDLSKGIDNPENNVQNALNDMKINEIKILTVKDIEKL